ncbi:TLC domain-containing protein [Sphaerosporella brunnea]|uniref:TLC domain-containing protein n=1 Tax=Sphaerosporella brunnea TaxID=1250544 RepID=A0A5J5EE19_9PEZI|nr:TLC domain-containing protein [Sphaerosporella brunnea]KAA8892988.1 TLC domain-containing protein [Sphaerosporella brunnea]
MHLLWNSPYWFNMQQLWTDWPLRETTGLFKWYYLAQFAFWLQQIFVLNIEERRKDHYQMFAHHIITYTLIASSYCYHMTRVGHVILCIMDVIDILLSVAKLLKYLGYSTSCDFAFGIFLVGWIIGRHGMYNWIVYSVWKDSVVSIPVGCYGADGVLIPARRVDFQTLWRTFTFQSETVCFTPPIQRTFVALLVGLQIITLIWLFMILRVAYRVVRGAGADDTRSEDEDEEDDELEELEDISKQPTGTASAETIARMVGTNRTAKSVTNGHALSSHLPSQPLGEDG